MKKVLVVDLDQEALAILRKNIEKLQLSEIIDPYQCDLRSETLKDYFNQWKESFSSPDCKILTISNPPFGVHQHGIDLVFLKQAMAVSDIIYSIHASNEQSRVFLQQQIEKTGWIITERVNLNLILKHTYDFHTKKQKKIQTDVIRCVRQ